MLYICKIDSNKAALEYCEIHKNEVFLSYFFVLFMKSQG